MILKKYMPDIYMPGNRDPKQKYLHMVGAPKMAHGFVTWEAQTRQELASSVHPSICWVPTH